MPWNWQRIANLIACFPFCSFAFASTPTLLHVFNANTLYPIVAVSAGTAFSQSTTTSKNFPAQNGLFSFYNYADHLDNQNVAMFGIFLGGEIVLNPQWNLQAGLGYYQPSAFAVNGTVTQGVSIASANQYTYQYKIQSRQLLVDGKLLYRWCNYHPYLAAGLGAGWNEVQDYTVNIQPPFTTFSNQFKNNTRSSFSYSLGFGVDVDVLENLRLGVGYRFADFGPAETGTSMIDTVSTNYTLSQPHLYSNELLVQLTAILR